MALVDVTDWMNEFGTTEHIWYAKRLSANDTLANHSHQAGPYFPKDFLLKLFPALNRPDAENPDVTFNLYIDSHSDHREVRAVWYNNKLRGGTRNEARLTGFGGASSALLDPDSTGALAVFSFSLKEDQTAADSHVWVCRHSTEEDLIEDRLGPVEPKQMIFWTPGTAMASDLFMDKPRSAVKSCSLDESEMPPSWIAKFPSGETIIRKTLELRPPKGLDPDDRLLRRRRCEYEIFQSIEKAVFLPRIKTGDFATIESFIGLAQSILQSRKSRSGNSLELHAREIMLEEGLIANSDFSHKPTVESGKRPDFIFPSQAAYNDISFPEAGLRMLAAKTTCKDRWRQVINEANRIKEKHLLTLQEGVSEGQFAEMREEGIKLVVPAGLHASYSENVRPHLISFESFIADIRLLSLTHRP